MQKRFSLPICQRDLVASKTCERTAFHREGFNYHCQWFHLWSCLLLWKIPQVKWVKFHHVALPLHQKKKNKPWTNAKQKCLSRKLLFLIGRFRVSVCPWRLCSRLSEVRESFGFMLRNCVLSLLVGEGIPLRYDSQQSPDKVVPKSLTARQVFLWFSPWSTV